MRGDCAAAGQTPNTRQRAVQLNDRVTARSQVKTIHILGDDPGQTSRGQSSQGNVASVGLGLGQGLPADHRSGPIAAPVGQRRHEVVVHHGSRGRGSRAAVVGDSRIGTHAGPGQGHPPCTVEDLSERCNLHGHVQKATPRRQPSGMAWHTRLG